MALKITKHAAVFGAKVQGDLANLPGVVLPDDEAPDGKSDISELTEDSLAEEFVVRYGNGLRYDHDIDAWFRWTGTHWKIDKTEFVFDSIRHLIREIRCGDQRMSSRKATEGVEAFARRDRRIATTSEIWNRSPWLLGTPGKTVDLRAGVLGEPNPADFITRLTSVAPSAEAATCSNFTQFLHQVTSGDLGVQRLLQQISGYYLTGETNEHILLFIYGPGGNGKSVLQTVFKEILGDYAVTAAMETFAASEHQRHPTELAMLHGARFVGVSETEKGQKWAEARINQLTGGDTITARFMRKDHFSFRPQFKLMIVGNHKPHLSTVNVAVRRRFIIVQFLHKPEKPDPKLLDKLRAEFPAILHWMIDGCVDWLANGLVIPASVRAATEEYFDEQDSFGRWISDCCDCGPGKKAKAMELYGSWKEFAEANGETQGSSKIFGATLAERGFEKAKSGVIVYKSIALKSSSS